MVNLWVSHLELRTEVNLGVIKYQGQFYQVDFARLWGMVIFSMGVNILRTQHFYIHWEQMVDLR